MIVPSICNASRPPLRQAEVGATHTMLMRTRDRFDLFPARLAADTSYGSGNMLGWLVGQNIELHIPVIDRSDRKDGTFSNLDFNYDPATNEYTCPGGNPHKKYWRKMRTADWCQQRMASSVTTRAKTRTSSHGMSMRLPATRSARSPKQMPTQIQADDERRSKCSLHISRRSRASTACVFADQAASNMNFFSLQPPKTSASSQSCSQLG